MPTRPPTCQGSAEGRPIDRKPDVRRVRARDVAPPDERRSARRWDLFRVILSVRLGSRLTMMVGVVIMGCGDVSVVGGQVMVAAVVVLGCLAVMVRGVLVMGSGVFVVLGCGLRHTASSRWDWNARGCAHAPPKQAALIRGPSPDSRNGEATPIDRLKGRRQRREPATEGSGTTRLP